MLVASPDGAPISGGLASVVRLALLAGCGLMVGAFTLGLAPWTGPVEVLASLAILAAAGAAVARIEPGRRGWIALHVGLFVGLGVAIWLRISLSSSGMGGFRSILRVEDWRLLYGAAISGGLGLASLGHALASRWMSPVRSPIPLPLVPGASMLGAVVIAAALGVVLGWSPLVIPPGAQILQVTVTDGVIGLEPSTLNAGEIHIIRTQAGRRYEGPFLVSGSGPDGTIDHIVMGRLTDADIAVLKAGDVPGAPLREGFMNVPSGEPVAWPSPSEYGGHAWYSAGEYAFYTVEVGDFPEHAWIKDLAFFTVR